jgi:hypothetical protein
MRFLGLELRMGWRRLAIIFGGTVSLIFNDGMCGTGEDRLNAGVDAE